MSKYVRREVRDLLDADRIRVLDAMQTLYHTSQEEGEKQYGSGFKNIAYFNFVMYVPRAGKSYTYGERA